VNDSYKSDEFFYKSLKKVVSFLKTNANAFRIILL